MQNFTSFIMHSNYAQDYDMVNTLVCILMTQWSFVIVHVWNDANPNLFKVLQNQDHEWCQESIFVKYNPGTPNMNILMDMKS